MSEPITHQEPLLRIMALHALAYCKRLFYLEDVEEIRVADHRVYAGRTPHEAGLPEDGGELVNITLESERWGMKGTLDYSDRSHAGSWGRSKGVEHIAAGAPLPPRPTEITDAERRWRTLPPRPGTSPGEGGAAAPPPGLGRRLRLQGSGARTLSVPRVVLAPHR